MAVHFRMPEAEGQQGESEREMAEDRGGASRGDVIVHGGLPSCMCPYSLCGDRYMPFTSAQTHLRTSRFAHLTWENVELRAGSHGMTTTGRWARLANRPATDPKMRPTMPWVEPTTIASASYSRPTSSSSWQMSPPRSTRIQGTSAR